MPTYPRALGPAKMLSGTVSGTGDIIASTLAQDFATFSVQLTGTWAATIQWQVSNDNSTWVACRAQNMQDATSILGSTTANGVYRGSLGVLYFRLTCSAYTSGTIVGAVLLHPEHMATIVKST